MGLATLRMSLGIPYRMAEASAWPWLMAMTRRDWRGQDNLGFHGDGIIVCPNHISWFDPLVVAHFLHDSGRPPRFVAKQSVFEVPIFGQWIGAAGQIPLDRGSDPTEALASAEAAVRSGECLVIYPEGTLTRDPNLWPMTGKTGAVRLSLQTGAPVIPVAQWGPQEVMWPYKKEFNAFPPKLMQVRAGDPITFDDLRGKPVTAALLKKGTARVMAAITDMLADMRGETPPAKPFDWAAEQKKLKAAAASEGSETSTKKTNGKA